MWSERNPRHEIRNPKQIQNPKYEFSIFPHQIDLALEILNFGFVSDFGFRISDFINHHSPGPLTTHQRISMYDRLMSSVVAVSLAFLVWLYARSRGMETLDGIPIPVRITLESDQANDYELEITGPSQVTASFMGTPSRLRSLRSLLSKATYMPRLLFTFPRIAKTTAVMSKTSVSTKRTFKLLMA